MQNEKLLLFLLATVQFSHIVDFMIIMPLGAQFMDVFSISPQQFSQLVSVYAFAAFVGSLVSAAYIDRYDRRRALLFLYAGFTIGTLLCGLSNRYEVLMLCRAFTGLFGGTLGGLVLVIVGDNIPLERRASAMGWVMTAFSVASVVGVPAGIWIAAQWGWRAPFLLIAAVSVVFMAVFAWVVPPLRAHLDNSDYRPKPHPLDAFRQVWQSSNQRQALLFSLVLILGHFTIIPFIAPYMQLNVGFSNQQVTYIYLVGGSLTAVLLPLLGRLSDRIGHQRLFTIASFFALLSILMITHLPAVPIVLALVVTSSFFVGASGRNVPATTLVTAVVRPENRGGFMSIRQSVNEAGLAISSLVAGMIIVEMPDGSLGHYSRVGYLAIGMSLLAIVLAQRLRARF